MPFFCKTEVPCDESGKNFENAKINAYLERVKRYNYLIQLIQQWRKGSNKCRESQKHRM